LATSSCYSQMVIKWRNPMAFLIKLTLILVKQMPTSKKLGIYSRDGPKQTLALKKTQIPLILTLALNRRAKIETRRIMKE
jgi:hypothetical protein